MIYKISVDLDGLNFYQLFNSYLNAKRMLGNKIKDIKVEWSASGRGFHILIDLNKPIPLIENILIRSCLFDDERRLRYSLNKYYIGVPDGVDVCFNYKKKKYTKPFEMPKNLTIKNLEKLADEYQEKYKNRDEKWIMVEFDKDSELDKYHEIGLELKQKLGVNYRIYRNFYKYSRWIFIVYYSGDLGGNIFKILKEHNLSVKI